MATRARVGIEGVDQALIEIDADVPPDGGHLRHRPAERGKVGAAVGNRLAAVRGEAEQGRRTGGVEHQGQRGEGLATGLVAGRRQQGADQEDVADIHDAKDNDAGAVARREIAPRKWDPRLKVT